MTIRSILLLMALALPAGAARADAYAEAVDAEARGTGDSVRLAQTDDEYLRMLEAESSEPDPATVGSRPRTTRDRIEPGLDRRNFERILKTHFIGLYRGYERLGEEDRDRVYRSYGEDNSVRKLRKYILRLRLKAASNLR